MAKRFTVSDKWENVKFRKYSPDAKLLFLYILDKCDIAGFWEIDLELAAFSIGKNMDWEPVLEELSNSYITVSQGLLWVKNFIYYQGNWPLRDNVPAHKAIARILCQHKSFSNNVLSYLESKTSVRVTQELVNSISHSHSISNSRSKGKSKGKEEKTLSKKHTNKRFTPPTLTDIEQYIKDNGYSVNAKDFYKYYTVSNWVDSRGNKVKNWKQRIISWNNPNRKKQDGRNGSPAPLEFNAETARQREQMMAELSAKMGVQD